MVSSEPLVQIYLEPMIFKIRNRAKRAVNVGRKDPSTSAAFIIF